MTDQTDVVGYLVEYLHTIDYEWRTSDCASGRGIWTRKAVADMEADTWREDGYEARVVPVIRGDTERKWTAKDVEATAEVARVVTREFWRGVAEERKAEVLSLRSLVARLPITHCNEHPDLQAWWDEMKEVMETTAPALPETEEDG